MLPPPPTIAVPFVSPCSTPLPFVFFYFCLFMFPRTWSLYTTPHPHHSSLIARPTICVSSLPVLSRPVPCLTNTYRFIASIILIIISVFVPIQQVLRVLGIQTRQLRMEALRWPQLLTVPSGSYFQLAAFLASEEVNQNVSLLRVFFSCLSENDSQRCFFGALEARFYWFFSKGARTVLKVFGKVFTVCVNSFSIFWGKSMLHISFGCGQAILTWAPYSQRRAHAVAIMSRRSCRGDHVVVVLLW